MLEQKDSVNGFSWIEFYESPIVDCQMDSPHLFDLTSGRDSDFSSDFLLNGDFDYRQYCLCLLETAFYMSTLDDRSYFPAFLNYQCGLLRDPFPWLIQFETLLNSNRAYLLTRCSQRDLEEVNESLKEKRKGYYKFISEKQSASKLELFKVVDDRFKIEKVKEELEQKDTHTSKLIFLIERRKDYLQEIEDDENASFIKKLDMELDHLKLVTSLREKEKRKLEQEGKTEGTSIKKVICIGTSSQVSDIFGQFREVVTSDNRRFFDGSTTSFAKLICLHFSQENGKPFMESSIRKGLTNYLKNKRPREKDRIDISNIKLKRDADKDAAEEGAEE